MLRSPVVSIRVGNPKRLAIWLLSLVLFTSALAPGTINVSGLGNSSLATDMFVLATSDQASTLDPALAYDTSSDEVIQNIYETLVFYDGTDAGSVVPQLASSYELSGDGLTWTFHIRPGVTFHNGASLTASDVAYSFQRGLLQGGSASAQWLLTEAFFGVGIDDISLLVDPTGSLYNDRAALSAWNPAELVATCQQVRAAIVANNAAGTVTMHLAQPWTPFLSTIAGTWGSIMDKDWTVAQGSWNDSCSTWQNWYAMEAAEDPLSSITNGTGPFKLDYWLPGQEIVLVRNNSYWRTPARLQGVDIKIVPDDTTRFALLQSGNADEIRPVGNLAVADQMVGENCVWNINTAQYDCSIVDAAKPLRRYTGRPGISRTHVLLNFEIAIPESGNPFAGSGQLDGNGIPYDFFSDVHIRKAFNYCFDWDTYAQVAFNGEFSRSITLALEGMPGYDLSAPHYTFNLTQCQAELALADLDHDGIPSASDIDDVTQVGFHFQLPYNEGSISRQTIMEILADSLSQIDPKFVIDVVALPWTTYLDAQSNGLLPLMTGGWFEDIHDSHNWYQPFLVGMFSNRTHIPDNLRAQFDTLINQGVSASGFSARHAIYQQLNQLVYDQTPFILLGGPTNHDFIQRWVKGRILNQAFAGNYYYPIYTHTFADVSTGYWSWSYIERLYNAGVTSGCGNGNYCPTTTVTRDQMAVFLLKGKHGSSYVPPTATGDFLDVPANYWAAAWIEQLAAEGITAGCGGGNYCPTTPVTRDQMAVFLLKAKHGSSYVPPAATGDFLDVPASYWAAAWIEQLALEGVTAGCGGGNYCPATPVTRDQMAVFLVKNFNLP
jgi:peptide/nickel transport system substrate-binding protein